MKTKVNISKDTRLNNIIKILVKDLKPKRLIIFGSRGKGTSSFNSDYDIAIESEKINLNKKRIIKDKIDDVIGLYKIDLVYLNEVDNDFRDIVIKTGKVIYEE